MIYRERDGEGFESDTWKPAPALAAGGKMKVFETPLPASL
jgi:hypothetical protein